MSEIAPSALRKRRPGWGGILLLLSLALAGMALLSIWTAESDVAQRITPAIVLRVLAHHLPLPVGSVSPVTPSQEAIVWQIRLPRVLGGALVGMLLAMAGVAFQSFLMNPLADPYMVGVSSGSALGSALVILLGGVGWLAGFAQTLAAFAMGMLTMFVISGLARVGGRLSAQTFLMAGFVIGAFVFSITKLVVALANRANDTSRAAMILSQLLGSLNGVDWRSLLLLLPFGILGGALLLRSARELNMMALGEESAAHLGVDTEAFKRKIIVSGSLVTAATVAVAGIIGFVGMVVPHIARRMVGPDHRRLLPVAMLLGGLTLLLADWLSRVYLNQLEVGVITSVFGAPVFCYLLRRHMTAHW